MTTKRTTTAPDPVVRFIAKPYGKFWRVYDRLLGSYPVCRPEFDSALPTYADEESCAACALTLDEQHRSTTTTTQK